MTVSMPVLMIVIVTVIVLVIMTVFMSTIMIMLTNNDIKFGGMDTGAVYLGRYSGKGFAGQIELSQLLFNVLG